MRLLLHDFSGHPFQAQLARSLADRGHDVMHVQCSSYASGKGDFETAADDNPQYVSLSVGSDFARYRLRERAVQELQYGRRFVAQVKSFEPDLVISCNDPLLAKSVFGAWARTRHVPWLFWLQDLYSIAMTRAAEKRSAAGRAVGAGFQATERWLLRHADAVVSITSDFDVVLDQWGIDRERRTVIENWAPLDELPVRDHSNPWQAAQGLGTRPVYLYAGTLGLKHNPDLLFDLAAAEPDIDVVVISEGLGADRLRERSAAQPLDNLRLLPFQEWSALPDIMGTADVLLVLLEAEAGLFSVPSKILSCLCAGRPILAAMPAENLGARAILGAEAGIVVDPSEPERFMEGARALRTDPALRQRMGAAGRAYAEKAFDIDDITDRFELAIKGALNRVRTRG